MFAFAVRRVFVGVLMLIAMSLVVFILFFAGPVDAAKYACGQKCNQQAIDATAKSLGFDKPVVEQWGSFMTGLVKGREYPLDPEMRKAAPETVTRCDAPCLGYSVPDQQTVNEELANSAPVSISLAVFAIIVWLTFGILLGVLAAVVKGTLLDRGIVGFSLLLYAFPTFFIGALLLKFVAIKWDLYPVPEYVSIADGGIGQWATNLVLPGITLAVFYMAGYVRMSRAFVLESMSEDYIRTARAKGLKGRTVLFKHGLRAALTPLVSMAGLDIAAVLGGAIITEDVFNFYGLGRLAVSASRNFDLSILVGLVLVLGALVIVANIIVDILYAFIDPRVRVA
ncbi:ABC transporter permease [Nocardioides sp. LML1-1-1.1]|uniref:ABC transporter permease n=1 Tax=Nocardioides sp. LML1-1-1.1 TaxID=3135248 RepID=UPI00342070EA